MGMAASQARLLTITARLADNELRSQTINNAKMRLATQSSQASENYINALNNATLKFASYDETGNALSQDLTYNALTAYSSYNTQYGLINSAGQILVSESEAAMFVNANGNLNAYLKAHGLEYTTTYFDELGAVKNDAYPVPFNNIAVDDLQKYYEQYGSYENSLEVEEYQTNYGNYIKADNNLIRGSAEILETYLSYSSLGAAYTLGENFAISAIDNPVPNTAAGAVAVFKNAFKLSGNNYALASLVGNELISEATQKDLEALIDSYTALGDGRIKYTDNERYTVGLPDELGQQVFTLDTGFKITVNSDGNVIAIDEAGAKKQIEEGAERDDGITQSFTFDYPKDDEGNIEQLPLVDFINGLSYTINLDDGGTPVGSRTYSYSCSEDTNGNLSIQKTHYYDGTSADDLKVLKEDLQASVHSIVTSIIAALNYENFAEYILKISEKDPLTGESDLDIYGIDINMTIPELGKTLDEILKEFTLAKNEFLSNIFDDASIPQVEEELHEQALAFTEGEGADAVNYYVTPVNLTDIDFVLKYINARGGAIKQSEEFNTVIKEFLIENLIEVYGEPKYAWVDMNDTANTGNADAKAQWYTNLFNRMNQGFKTLENGLASSKEWIEYALETGIVTLEQVDKNFRWNGLNYKTCIKITEETDDAAVTKAEAEYNRAMNDIEAKDNIFDLELKNIDTEHSALQTEYDVIKGVIDKNISRTFKFNQSA